MQSFDTKDTKDTKGRYQPEPSWVNAFHSIGNFSAIMGKGPARWQFQGNIASIDATENQAQQCIDHFKSYLPSATQGLKQILDQAEARKKHELEERLRREREAEEARLRVTRSLKY